MKRLLVAIVPLVLISLCPLSSAQVCMRGKPSPECEFVFLTEASYALGQRGWQMTSEFGGIYNLHRGHALGSSVFLNLDHDKDEDDSELGVGVKARYRYWLEYPLSLDFAPGVLLYGTDLESPAFFGHVALNYGDWIGLVAQADRVNRWWSEDASTNYSVGIKAGSYAGLAIMIGVSALIIFASLLPET